MDDTLVSSRISRAKKEAGVAILESSGSSISELINSAFDYVLEHKRLPNATDEAKPSKRDFKTFVANSTVSIDWDDEARTDKEILQQRLVGDYESLT